MISMLCILFSLIVRKQYLFRFETAVFYYAHSPQNIR